MIYSAQCIDETQGFELTDIGTLKPNKLGRYVYTIKELNEMGD